jgi:hypothetical protein
VILKIQIGEIMFSKKVIVSSLLAALVGISSLTYANIKLVKTTDGSEQAQMLKKNS